MSNFVIVRRYASRVEADLAKGFLASNGIEALISGGDLGGTNPWMGLAFNVNVLVEEKQLALAETLLASTEKATPPSDTPQTPRSGLLNLMQTVWAINIIYIVATVGRENSNQTTLILIVLQLIAYSVTFLYVYKRNRVKNRKHDA